ncbi:MAG TPA: FAD-dependent oxidoreductase [Parvularculaceae bacterium]|nr:FAD-dependent oxidoreductase [Parvularculaceae bacterium]
MPTALPKHSQIVIVGGGVAGCSIAYHLCKLGITDVVLLERGQLTCGTTWHAAGLVMQLRTTEVMTRLAAYGTELYHDIIAETGQETGLKRNGSLAIASTEDRLIEINRMCALGRAFNIESHALTPSEAKDVYPYLDDTKIAGAVFIPRDGQTNPVDTTVALAKGAKRLGAKIVEGVRVEGFVRNGNRVSTVQTSLGDIDCETVVLAAGIWNPPLGAKAGVKIPLYASEHMYVLAQADFKAPPTLPVLRHTDGFCYIKEDAGKFLVGAFEPKGKPLPLGALPAQPEFIELEEDWNQFELPLSKAIEVVPALENAQITKFMNGPESFTPDNRFIVGQAPEAPNVFVCGGFNSQGILAGAGVGRALAEWIAAGSATIDLSEIDIARFHDFQINENYLKTRISESLGLLYAMHWPHRQFETARPIRRTPLYHRLKGLNACMGEAAGWERANWFAPSGVEPTYEYSYGRQNWFEHAAAEHKAVRTAAGLFDLSSFSKFLVQGAGALEALQYICSNNVDVEPERTVYTLALNSRGGIQAEFTIQRLKADSFMLISATAQQSRDFAWLHGMLAHRKDVAVTDVTSGYATLLLTGPRARDILQRATNASLSNEDFPFGTVRDIDIGFARARAVRMSFAGELGWELHPSTEFAEGVFDALMAAGEGFGLKPAGYHALDSLRLEKGYFHWGHDIGPGDTPLEAGLGFAAPKRKIADYLGKDALDRQRKDGVRRRFVYFKLRDPDPLLIHNEPIYRNGVCAGTIASGGFGHTIGASIGGGYVALRDGEDASAVAEGRFEIDIAGDRHEAIASLQPFYDPSGERLRM